MSSKLPRRREASNSLSLAHDHVTKIFGTTSGRIANCIIENLLRLSGVLLVFISAIYGCLEFFKMLPDLSQQYEVINIVPDPSDTTSQAFSVETKELDDHNFQMLYRPQAARASS